ncbi:ParB N-terminal domain-containing protein [Amycolatopsis thailandensis]|uniref:ParB N-terminal domain-containing protein n=1 Tax=Amycolatopsis thailandensis TaxID=589330 RepID=UPI001FC9D0D9|nr:ParB N-terminal domain-containing protein [Amycolatopsis thailandensis]
MRFALGRDDLQPTEEVEIRFLSAGDSPRIAGESMEHVEMLVAASVPLPPIVVHRPSMRVIDGVHRLRAAMLAGRKTIAVRFFEGTEEDAFILAVESNTTHGLPLSTADRRQAAERIIVTHSRWSDRMIASVVGMSAKTVAAIRRDNMAGEENEAGRIGRDGRVRSIDVSAGRKLAHEIIVGNPSLSLRQVARAAGISAETVRDVKKRMLRGDDPVPRKRQAKLGEWEPDDRLSGRVVARYEVKPPPALVMARLREDPALRLNENGRDLLRLLNIHMVRSEDWNRLVDSVPPHSTETIAELARYCAEKWSEIAFRIEHKGSKSA